MQDDEWLAFQKRRERSSFRMRFNLSAEDRDYVVAKGTDTIRSHAYDFISKRLAPAHPKNDGRQTPMRGHPVFKAQHALGCCCRSCLRKWHGIPEGREMEEDEIQYIVSLIMRWIEAEMQDAVLS